MCRSMVAPGRQRCLISSDFEFMKIGECCFDNALMLLPLQQNTVVKTTKKILATPLQLRRINQYAGYFTIIPNRLYRG